MTRAMSNCPEPFPLWTVCSPKVAYFEYCYFMSEGAMYASESEGLRPRMMSGYNSGENYSREFGVDTCMKK